MMNARIAAALGLRIIALWILLEGISSVVAYGILRSGLNRHAQSSRPAAEVESDVTVVQQWERHAVSVGIPSLIIGGILLLSAKPLAKIVARGLE